MQLRPYQETLKADVLNAWNSGARNICAVSPTGSGKTHLKSNIHKTLNYVSCCIAHRQELVLQISESLAIYGIYHNIIAPASVVRFCAERHMRRTGRSFYSSDAPTAVAGVQTLLRRQDELSQFFSRVQLWDIDECHHALPDNQWGKATQLFPRALGLGVTATPLRCDRKALDGVFDRLVVGPSMRELIDQGHLSDYRIFCPPQSLDTNAIRVSQSSGEFVKKDLIKETEKSTIVGDVVSHYLRIAPGKRGLTFAVDVQSASNIADAYNAAGVPAAVVTAKTPDRIRTDLLDRLASGEIKQLVNVDLFGEGMDCPALEVVSMARPTQSYGLYVQQFGRVLRTAEDKEHGIVIDHVGNVVRHGLPDRERQWSLAAPEGRRARTADPDEIPLTTCTECFRPYERVRTVCPYCGHKPVPSGRTLPEQVDGDLIELDPATLAQMRSEVDRMDGGVQIPNGVSDVAALAVRKKWNERQSAQGVLRDAISAWAGVRKYGHGESDREIQKRFYLGFGVDVVTAQTLGAKEAAALTAKIREYLT
jgi:superfamily II DNA or RNA helicase